MKTNTARTISLVTKPSAKKKIISPIVRIRKDIRYEARTITFVAHLNLFVCFASLTILSILDSYIKDFIDAMETTGSVNIGITSTIAAILVFFLGCCMTIFSFVIFLYLNSSAQALRKSANELTEV